MGRARINYLGQIETNLERLQLSGMDWDRLKQVSINLNYLEQIKTGWGGCVILR